MRALVWHGGHDFRVEDVAAPKPGHGQVIVRVEAAAVCGSDFHLDNFGCIPPLIPGHEVAGVVSSVGEGVTDLSVGTRVALDPVQRCGACWPCRNGIVHLCENCRHLGDRDVPGGWAEFVAIDAGNAHTKPEGVSFDAAALTEPVAVCYESFQRAGFRKGQSVLVLGDGPFGFLHTQIALALGADPVIVAGHCDARLAAIASETGVVTRNTRDRDLRGALKQHIDDAGVDVVIEATGSGSAPNEALRVLRPRGTIVVFSYIWKPEPLEMGLIHMRELNVLGSCRSLNAYKPCLELMAQGQVRVEPLISLRVPLGSFRQALEQVASRKEETFKVLFSPQEA